jgi:peptidoglycan/xylan/chitin deacetylase (PgdA/CDA1 family)
VEIPPVPNGYRFIACLTHDVDHPSIRRHMLDRTMFGFLYRAVIASFFAVLRGRANLRTLLTNWAAALKLPFIYLGLAKDFWNQLDAYTRLEGRARSSFFVIPFKGRPGANGEKPAPAQRASGYSADDIALEVRQLQSEGHEIGLHGIDAWHDSSKARVEMQEIRQITGTREVGVRMHWLYFDKRSPAVLEAAGIDYDSTVGYNEAVGYRAGTAQVYKPLEAAKLLELPLHIMDTALFFPGRQNLSPAEASKIVAAIIEHAVLLGGVVTINWHDRSIAPERLWGGFYSTILEECDKKGAWFASAGETVRWFRARRAATFDEVDSEAGAQSFHASGEAGKRMPGLFLRIHSAGDQALRDHDTSYGSGTACTQSEATDTMVQRG